MDVSRHVAARSRRICQIQYLLLEIGATTAISTVHSHLEPEAPRVDRSTLRMGNDLLPNYLFRTYSSQ